MKTLNSLRFSRPTDTLEIWFIIIFAIFGALLYTLFQGIIYSFSFGLDASGRMYKQKMDEVNEYMEWKHVPEEIRRKVRHYYALKYRGKFFEEVYYEKQN
jgi:hyperpolarization activated cyclic nucleotide-gated potassium channel 2